MKEIRNTYLSKYMEHNRFNFFMGIFLAVLKAFMNIFFAFLMEIIMNFALSKDFSKLTDMILLCLVNLLLYGAILLGKMYYQNRFYRNALVSYRKNTYHKITNKDILTFQKKRTGNYMSILSNDVNSIEINYLESLFELPENLVLLCGSMIAMIVSNPLFFGCVLVSSVLPLLSTLLFNKKIKLQEQIISSKNEYFLAGLKDIFSGFSIIKSFKVEDETEKLYNKYNYELENAKFKKRNMMAVVSVFSECAGLIVFIVVFLVGAILVIKHLITVGLLAAYVQLVNYIVDPIGKLPLTINKMKAAKGLMEKTNDILSDDLQKDGTMELQKFDNQIEFQDVNFSYESNEVLHNINVKIEKGKSYAVVGVSGSGKTTFLNLLMGYYKNYKGSITFDQLELSDIKTSSLFEFISVIQQDVFVFDDDIISNITMHKSFDKEKIEMAIHNSGLSKLIQEKGRDYQCGENGSHLSGGEKQRISIARCLLRESPILLLDEAMSALDNETAHMTETAILELNGLTRVVVTHKLDGEMLKQYDQIIMFNNGKIVEQGSFKQLMNNQQLFYSLYNVSNMNDK